MSVMRPGLQFVRELEAGEKCALIPEVGAVITHPDRPPTWVRMVAGKPVETTIGATK